MDDIKKLIRSILISSPLEMTVSKLDRDYNEEIGERIPFRKFGYNSLEEFLRSMPDILEVLGYGKDAVLRVIADKKVAHIDRLVSLQRPPAIKRRRFGSRPRRRRSSALCESALHPKSSSTYTKPSCNNYTVLTRYNVPCRQPLLPTPLLPYNVPCRRPILPTPLLPYNVPCRQPILPTPSLPRLMDINFQNSYTICYPTFPVTSPKPMGAVPKRRTDYNQDNLFKKIDKSKSDYSRTSTIVNVHNKPAPLYTLHEPESKTSPVKSNNLHSPKEKTNIKDYSINQSNNLHSPKEKTNIKDYSLNQSNNLHLPKPEINLENHFFSQKLIDTGNISKQSIDNLEDVVYYSEEEDILTDEEVAQPEYEIPVNYNVPFKVQENLKTLIIENTNGIWCRDLPKVYKEKFHKPLDYEEYGYRSLIQMCLDLENIFYCYRPSHGDFILHDNTVPLTQDQKDEIERKHSKKSNKNTNKLSESNNSSEPALVGVEDYVSDINIENFPDDVMRYGDEIPRQFVPSNIKENSFLDVIVAEVYDPSKFWVILRDMDDSLNDLMDAIQYYYRAVGVSYLIPQYMLKEGLYCVSRYNQEYHRAVIVRINRDNKTVKVFYVDYGTISNADASGLLFLDKQFASFPRQAIRARLASIWPTTAYTPWSTSASNRFLTLVRQKELVAHIYKIHQETKIVEVFLADTSTEEDIYMNDTLVNEGYALFTNQDQKPKRLHPRKIPKYKYIHLYPNFDDLETGNAPSATEIIRMSKAGVQDEYMYPNYYEDITNENDVSLLYQHTESAHHGNLYDGYDNISDKIDIPVKKDWTAIVEQESAVSEQNLQEFQETASYQGSSSSPVLTTPVSNLSSSASNSNSTKESSSVITEPAISTNTLKPPPGFENVPRHYYFASTTINLNPADNLPTITNQTNPNILMYPNNFNPNTHKVPNLTTQTPTIPQPLNVVPPQQTLNPTLAYLQLQMLMNNYQSSQPYLGNFNQNVLINQQNPLFLQQNPLIQQSYLYNQSNPWNNLHLNQDPSVSIDKQPVNLNTPRQLLQNCIKSCLMKGNIELLEHLEGMFRNFQDITPQSQQRHLLFKIVCEMVKNPSVVVNRQNLATVITNFLNLLNDAQVVQLATKLVSVSNNWNVQNNTLDPTKETLEALAELTIHSKKTAEDSQSYNAIDKGVPNIMDEASKSLVFRADLENRPVHIVRYKNSLYVPVNDALQFTSPKPTLDVIRKTVMLLDPLNCIKNIDLNENIELAREFLRYGISDSMLSIIPLVLLPEVIKIHCGEMKVIKDFEGFLDKVNKLRLVN